MKKLIPLAILAMLIVGCGSKQQQTSATEVNNPPEPAPQQKQAAAPKPPATPPTPAPAVKSKSKDGWVTLASGLKYKDIKVGKGIEAVSGSRVSVQYKGWLDSGKVFDTSRQPGRGPYSLTIDNHEVIPGWEQGLKGMKVGGVRELTIPSDLGYGDKGMTDPSTGKVVIPPKATLHFEVELVDATK